jgi:hypothetical protein
VGRHLRLPSLADVDPRGSTPWRETPVTVERWTELTGDDAKTQVRTLGIAGPVLELSDGTLVAGNHGNFTGDRVPMEGFVATRGEKWFKYRTYLLASTDGGESWRYRATVAYDGSTGQESFCEPGIAEVGNRELVAVMRTGRFAPMHQARSLDGGLTWGKPESLHIHGLAPQLALLSNGVLACSFGWRPFKRQRVGGGFPYEGALRDYRARYQGDVGIDDPSAAAGDYVMFSVDGGRTWTKPRRIALPLTVGYTWLAPAGPDSLLVLSQRITMPGESEATVARRWEHDWAEWGDRARRILEGRLIVVRR